MTTEHTGRDAEMAQGEENRKAAAPTVEIPLTGALRISGASAGELHGAIMREVRLAVAQANGNALETIKIGLARLQSLGLLTGREVRGLTHIGGLMLAVDHKERTPQEVCPKVRDYYYELVTSGDASQIALALASIAMDASITTLLDQNAEPEKSGQERAAATGGGAGWGVGGADYGGAVGGAVGGAIVGGALGGFAGALLGGVGASAGALIGGGASKT